MGREIIVYREVKYYRYPKSKYRDKRIYWHSSYKRRGYLHRHIYEDKYGKIPKGHFIHHKDHNSFNNEPSNLEAISPKNHFQLHFQEPWRLDVANRNLERARIAASKWHKSSEGRKWHANHNKWIWSVRKKYPRVCNICKKPYQTYWPIQSKYCSKQCKWKSKSLRLNNTK